MTAFCLLLLLTFVGKHDEALALTPASELSQLHVADSPITALASSPDGAHLAVGANDAVWLIDLSHWNASELDAMKAIPNGFTFSRNKTWLVATSEVGQVMYWNLTDRLPTRRIDHSATHIPIASFVGPKDKLLLVCRSTTRLTFKKSAPTCQLRNVTTSDILDPEPFTTVGRLFGQDARELPIYDGLAMSVASSDNRTFCVADLGSLRFWNSETGYLEYSIPFPEARVTKTDILDKILLTSARRGDWVVATDALGKLYAWDIALRKQLLEFQGRDGTLVQLTSSPDGQVTAALSSDGSLQIWHWNDLTYGLFMLNAAVPTCIALPRDDAIAVGTKNGDVQVYSVPRDKLSKDGFDRGVSAARKDRYWLTLDNAIEAQRVCERLRRSAAWFSLRFDGQATMIPSPEGSSPDFSGTEGLGTVNQIAIRGSDGQHMDSILGMSRLEMLSFDRPSFKSSDLEHLKNLRSLRSLSLEATDFDDTCWSSLGQLVKLERLVVESNNEDFTGKGIGRLAAINGLQELTILNRLPLASTWAEELTRLPTLRYISIRRCYLPAPGRAQLEQLFPNCEVHVNEKSVP